MQSQDSMPENPRSLGELNKIIYLLLITNLPCSLRPLKIFIICYHIIQSNYEPSPRQVFLCFCVPSMAIVSLLFKLRKPKSAFPSFMLVASSPWTDVIEKLRLPASSNHTFPFYLSDNIKFILPFHFALPSHLQSFSLNHSS